MIKSLRRKFVLTNMILVFMVLFAVFSFILVSNINKAKRESEIVLQMSLNRRPMEFDPAKRPMENYDRFPIFITRIGNDGNFSRFPVFIAEIEKDGSPELLYSDNIEVSDEMLKEVTDKSMSEKTNGGIIKEYNMKFLKSKENGETRIAFTELSAEQKAISNAILGFFLSLFSTMAVFFFISLFLSKIALTPAEKAWEQQRRFVSDASHELRTPLTVILANLGILESNKGDIINNQIKWVDNTMHEAERMRSLVDNLLFLAKSDSTKERMILDKVNLSEIAINIALSMESIAFERNISIDIEEVSEDIFVLGDKGELSRLVMILADNAVKYSKDYGTVSINLKESYSNKIQLKVTNFGEPLTKEDIEHIFDRFYRADKSRSKSGYGLGLSIAKSIVEGHKGTILAESSDGLTVFTVILNQYENKQIRRKGFLLQKNR